MLPTPSETGMFRLGLDWAWRACDPGVATGTVPVIAHAVFPGLLMEVGYASQCFPNSGLGPSFIC